MSKGAILVTGGAGRLGRTLVAQLVKEKREVHVLVRDKADALEITPGVVPFVGNITDPDSLSRACKGIETVFHLAAIVSQYRLGSQEIIRTNTLGTRMVAEAAKEAGAERIIFPSTLNVYGRVRKERLTESTRPIPTDIYGQSKLLAEEEIINSGLDYTIFRFATIYGEGFENSFLKIFKAVKYGKAYIVGNGKNHLALVNIKDAIRAFMLACDKKISSNKVYNISDGKDYTQEYLIGLVADLLKVERPQRHISPLLVKIVAKARGLDKNWALRQRRT
jgi:nucleoside-diphosphate-sugar epimerase